MTKEKKRNSEKRKVKSRDAARSRRGKETEVFVGLSAALPLPESVVSQLDKASVMRLSMSVLKIRNLLHHGTENVKASQCDKADQFQQKALEGFFFILSQEGDIVYLSESVAKYLGLQQIELMGQSMYEFTHPCDHEEMKEMLSSSKTSSNKFLPEVKAFFLRMKCTLTSKGRNVNLRSATYKVMRCSGRLMSSCEIEEVGSNASNSQCLVGIAEPIPHPANVEVPLDRMTFLSKHSMDMRFTFCDDRIQQLAGYSSEFMIDQSIYNFHHALDSDIMDKAFKNLFSKGQTMTGAYRFLARHGGYMWVVTQATVINNNRTQKPQWVVCVHYVLSGIEDKDCILSHVQCPASPPTLSSLLPPKVELSTENIFGPKTKDMKKGYFVPAEMKDTVTYLKNNEPEDLSYLAPNAGDESVPLNFTHYENFVRCPSLKQDVLKEEPDMGCNVPDIGCNVPDIGCNVPDIGCNVPDISCNVPDTCYRKDTSPNSVLSSNTSSRMASPSEYLSMAVPEDVDFMNQFFQSINTDEQGNQPEDVDFDLRAPYIPMDGDQDHDLLPPSSSSLFNLTVDVNPGLFGHTENVFTRKQALFEEPPPPLKRTVQDMLGGSTAKASIEQPPDTMYLQLKRPLDMNSLEKGPPHLKTLRLGAGNTIVVNASSPVHVVPDNTATLRPQALPDNLKDNCVLLNLLLRGEDRNYGYKVNSLLTKPRPQTLNKRPSSQLFPNLTRHDCEVNAPTAATHLLQGRELLRALDVVTMKQGGGPHT